MTDTAERAEDADDKVGEINLVGLFSGFAEELLLAVSEGRILHKTRNIADSGTPLEVKFRDFFARRLPPPFMVHEGYLFDPQSLCTPQLDFIISDGEETQVLLKVQDGATYSPFTGAFVIGEIKTSGADIGKHIEQVAKRVHAIENMYSSIGIPHVADEWKVVLPFLLIADDDGINDAHILKAWHKDPAGFPRYIVLLKRGQVIASANEFLSGERLDLAELPGLDLNVYAPAQPEGEEAIFARGRLLLWLFYTLMEQLRRHGPGRGVSHHFSRAIERTYPMVRRRRLSGSGEPAPDAG